MFFMQKHNKIIVIIIMMIIIITNNFTCIEVAAIISAVDISKLMQIKQNKLFYSLFY